jgi:hypothetical protein
VGVDGMIIVHSMTFVVVASMGRCRGDGRGGGFGGSPAGGVSRGMVVALGVVFHDSSL